MDTCLLPISNVSLRHFMLIRCTQIELTHLELEGLRGPRVGDVDIVGDEDVVEVDVARHGPQLDAHRADRRHSREGVRVVVVVGVGDARRLPLALVCRVGDQRRVPLPLVPEKLTNIACNLNWVCSCNLQLYSSNAISTTPRIHTAPDD